MPSLKDLKNRIGSVKSTQKITSAMKMVAAAKLRKAQEQAIASRPYCSSMEKIVSSLASKLIDNAPELLNKNIATQLFSAQMESTASELAARMTAMDNATRNAGDLIDRLSLIHI